MQTGIPLKVRKYRGGVILRSRLNLTHCRFTEVHPRASLFFLEATMDIAVSPKITDCTSCGESFEASSPTGGSQVLLAQCGWCERRYYITVLAQPSADIILSKEAMTGFTPSLHLSAQSASTMERLLVTLPGAATEEDDRRQYARVRAALRLVVAPLDSEYRPNCAGF